MRLFGLLVGLGLTLLPAALVGMNDWVELTFEPPHHWTLDLPRTDGGRVLYPVVLPVPVEGERLAYADCRVVDYDEYGPTITIGCPDTEDLVLNFVWLSEWLAGSAPAVENQPSSAFPQDLACAGGACECVGKCWACCPDGYLPSCKCVGYGTCGCTPMAEPDGDPVG